MVRRRLGVFWSVRWGRRSTGNSFKPGGGVFFFFWAVLGEWDGIGMGWIDDIRQGGWGGGLLYWYLEKEKGGCECGLFGGRRWWVEGVGLAKEWGLCWGGGLMRWGRGRGGCCCYFS